MTKLYLGVSYFLENGASLISLPLCKFASTKDVTHLKAYFVQTKLKFEEV